MITDLRIDVWTDAGPVKSPFLWPIAENMIPVEAQRLRTLLRTHGWTAEFVTEPKAAVVAQVIARYEEEQAARDQA